MSWTPRDYAGNHNFSTGVDTYATTLSVVTGDAIIVICRWETGGANDTADVATLTDDVGNTYEKILTLPAGNARDTVISVW